MLKAKDIMTTEVVTVHPQTTVEELARVLMDNHIDGAPVVDDAGNLVGIVTEHDLINQEKRLHIPTVVRIMDAFIYLDSPKKFEEDLKRMVGSKVGDICTQDVVTVDEEASVSDIASTMSDRGIHLLPVMRGKIIVGVVGREDMLKAVIKG